MRVHKLLCSWSSLSLSVAAELFWWNEKRWFYCWFCSNTLLLVYGSKERQGWGCGTNESTQIYTGSLKCWSLEYLRCKLCSFFSQIRTITINNGISYHMNQNMIFWYLQLKMSIILYILSINDNMTLFNRIMSITRKNVYFHHNKKTNRSQSRRNSVGSGLCLYWRSTTFTYLHYIAMLQNRK